MNRSDDDNDNLERRLRAVGRAVGPGSGRFTRDVMDRIAASDVPPHATSHTLTLRRLIMRTSMGLAACALVGVFVWTTLVREPERAYGMADVRQKIEAVQSLYMSGTGGDGRRFEFYVRRPDYVFRRDGDVRMVADGRRQTIIDDRSRSVSTGPANPVDVRYMAEFILRNQIVSQLLGPGEGRLTRLRTERIDGRRVDVYEGKVDQGAIALSSEIYLDPETALPVRSVLRVTPQGQPPTVIATIDRVVANGPPPAAAADVAAPADYARHELAGAALGAIYDQGGSSGHLHYLIRYAFDVDDRAMLMCWALYDDRHPGDDVRTLPAPGTFHATGPHGDRAVRTLRTEPAADGFHWRWSLIAAPAGDAPTTTFLLNLPDARFNLTVDGLPTSDPGVLDLLAETQRQTGARPLTVDELRGLLGRPGDEVVP